MASVVFGGVGFGVGVVAGVVVAGVVVVVAAGFVGVPLLGVATGLAVAPAAVVTPVAVVVPVVPAPTAAPLAETGSVVRGVGSGGSGFDRMLPIISFKPASESLWRNLYQPVKVSIQPFLFA